MNAYLNEFLNDSLTYQRDGRTLEKTLQNYAIILNTDKMVKGRFRLRKSNKIHKSLARVFRSNKNVWERLEVLDRDTWRRFTEFDHAVLDAYLERNYGFTSDVKMFSSAVLLVAQINSESLKD